MNKYRLLRFPGFRLKALTLSYDDGMVFDKKLIDILDGSGIKCTFNISSGLFAEQAGGRRLTKEESIELYKSSNHEVAVHGFRHRSLADIPEEMAVAEIIDDRRNLERLFGCIIKGMAYANGSFDDDTVDIVRRCGIRYARTTISSGGFGIPNDWLRLQPTCHHNSPRLAELTDAFLQDSEGGYFWRHNPKLFYLWGHSFEYNDNDNWNILESFAEKVGNREDVWYATNTEVYDYVQAYDRLECAADGKMLYNPTDKEVYLDWFGKNIVVPAGKTVTVE